MGFGFGDIRGGGFLGWRWCGLGFHDGFGDLIVIPMMWYEKLRISFGGFSIFVFDFFYYDDACGCIFRFSIHTPLPIQSLMILSRLYPVLHSVATLLGRAWSVIIAVGERRDQRSSDLSHYLLHS